MGREGNVFVAFLSKIKVVLPCAMLYAMVVVITTVSVIMKHNRAYQHKSYRCDT